MTSYLYISFPEFLVLFRKSEICFKFVSSFLQKNVTSVAIETEG